MKMATSSFKSTSRRASDEGSKLNPPAATARRRSHSVSAVSRKSHAPLNDDNFFSTEFSNSRDNPLFWAASSSPPDKEDGKIDGTTTTNNKQFYSRDTRTARNANVGSNSVGEQRGRSVTRSVSEKKGIGRSLSRVGGRSVSRGPSRAAYESNREQDTVTSTAARIRNETKKIGNGINRTNPVRNRADTGIRAKNLGAAAIQNQALEGSEDDSACSLQISNLEDGISIGSLSEAEEKTIKPAFPRTNGSTITATNVADIPSGLVDSDAVELFSDIRREYAIKLEESAERARKLRADLAIEEHHGQELDRILKEILPDSNTSDIRRSRRGRRASNERKRMSKRLSEEAMTYFDECVSISTFDSSDFSAPEDPLYSSVGGNIPLGASSLEKGSPSTSCHYDQGSGPHQKQIYVEQLQVSSCDDSGLTASSSSAEPGSTQLYQFSFANKKSENVGPQEDIRSCIKIFGRDANKDSDTMRSHYDAGEYSVYSHIESLLIHRVIDSSRIESGGLLLCDAATSFLPFASLML